MKRLRMLCRGGSWRAAGIALVVLLLAAWSASAHPQRDFRLEREIRWRLVPVFAGPSAGPAMNTATAAPKSRATPE